MAYIQKSKFERSRRYFFKKMRVTVTSIKWSKIIGRFNAPIVLSNSIPKSGTHLIEGMLEQLPPLRNAGVRTISENKKANRHKIAKKLKQLGKGAFYNAHLPARQKYIDSVYACNAKVLLLVRDPRDIAVSRYKYVTEIDMLHPAHPFFVNAANDEERLRMAITGVPGAMPPLAEVFRDFSGWLDCENTLVCKFEDLRGEAGGGSYKIQKNTVEKIITHLNFSGLGLDVDELIKKSFSKKSSTFRKGKIGGWRDEFDDASLDLLREEFGDAAAMFGYDLSTA